MGKLRACITGPATTRLTGTFNSSRPEIGVLVGTGLKYLNQSADISYQIFLNPYIVIKASTVFGGMFERKRYV